MGRTLVNRDGDSLRQARRTGRRFASPVRRSAPVDAMVEMVEARSDRLARILRPCVERSSRLMGDSRSFENGGSRP
jgi:hypothetical protein